MNENDPTFLGTVSGVSGASVTVLLADSLSSGLAIIDGHTYRVGQVGSFVRIPQGYQDLYGIVCEVGAILTTEDSKLHGRNSGRWMRIELAGEAIGGHFERGLSQHPNINDTAHIVTETDLHRMYGGGGDDHVTIGTLSSAENIPVGLALDALVTRHSAILGSTGSGKSTTVASLLRSIVRPESLPVGAPGARILLLDIHGEYTSALSDIAQVFSAMPQAGQNPLFVPYWALESRELFDLLTGDLTDNQEIAFADKIQDMRSESLVAGHISGFNPSLLTVDSPIPFSLKKLWHDLIDFETRTFSDSQRTQLAIDSPGDAEKLIAPHYKPPAMGSAAPFMNSAAKGIKRQLNLLRSRLLDRRYDFVLHPGPWEPDLTGKVTADLDELLQGWLGHSKQLTVLDLSGVPSTVLVRMIGSILRIVYEAIFWSREETEGGVLRPLLVVMEEAHRYLGPDSGAVAADVVKRIVKEGRKYGIGAMLISQRPAEIDETVLSQCGTLIALRLSNPADRSRVKGALPDNLSGLMDLLPVLRTGEAIIAGEAAHLPVRCRVTLPPERYQPRSADPKVADAWSRRRVIEGYDRVMASWRTQSTTAVAVTLNIHRAPIKDGKPAEGDLDMHRESVASNNIASVGYDEPSQTLEVEFLNGSIYQYYNVGSPVYEEFLHSSSKGQFLNANIRDVFPYSRV